MLIKKKINKVLKYLKNKLTFKMKKIMLHNRLSVLIQALKIKKETLIHSIKMKIKIKNH